MLSLSTIALLCAVTSSFCHDLSHKKPTPTPFQDWDYLVFSQRWPITGCTEWVEEGSKNTCNLPQDNTTWTIHGVWPTKTGTTGPYFCNSALHFDPSQLTPMLKELQQFWTNVENNTQPFSFWKHEWNKHGTCASTLPQLNSVTNFFKRGLLWNQQYKLSEILSKANIIPNVDGYNVSDVYNAVKASVGKNPTIQCVVDAKSKDSLISEIRICFDKNLDLIDCNVNVKTEDMGNCSGKKNVMYFAAVPNDTKRDLFKDVYFEEDPDIRDCLDSANLENFTLQVGHIWILTLFFLRETLTIPITITVYYISY